MKGRAALEAQHDWGFDRQAYLNSSEADHCIRRLWYSKHQPELAEPPSSYGYMRRGSHIESYVVQSLRAANVPLIYAGDEQVSIQDEERRLSATPDGVIAYEDHWEGFECKSIDPRTNKSKLPKPEHVTQFKIAMALVNNHLKLEGRAFSYGWLMYIDASNYDDILEFKIELDETILNKYAKKADRVFRTKSASTLDREGKKNGRECSMCAFKKTCDGVGQVASSLKRSKPAKPVQTPKSVEAVAGLSLKYLAASDKATEAAAEKARLSQEIKERMSQVGATYVADDRVVVSLTTSKPRTTLDRAAVKAAGIDLSKFETEGEASVRLNVKRNT
jgi:hypothetical protein